MDVYGFYFSWLKPSGCFTRDRRHSGVELALVYEPSMLFLICTMLVLIGCPLEQCRGVRDFRCRWRAMWLSLIPLGLILNRPSDLLSCPILRDANHLVTYLSVHCPKHLVIVHDWALVVTMMRHLTWGFYNEETSDMGHSLWHMCIDISWMQFLLSLPWFMLNTNSDSMRPIWGPLRQLHTKNVAQLVAKWDSINSSLMNLNWNLMGSINKSWQELEIKMHGRPKLISSMISRKVVDLNLDLRIFVGVFSLWFEIEMNDRSESDRSLMDPNVANLRS